MAEGDNHTVIRFSPRHRHAPEQRFAQAFQTRSVSSVCFDEHWSSTHLPWVRLAAGVLGKNDAELEAAICKLSFLGGKDDPLATLFSRWREAKRDLDEMRNALDVAMTRCLTALERVRCDPDNTPPPCA